MWKPESFDHEFKPSCSNQLSFDDYQQILEHVEHCASCRSAHAEFLSFLEQSPSAENNRVKDDIQRHVEAGGLRDRFLERARATGIQLSECQTNPREHTPRRLLSRHWMAAAAVVIFIVAAAGERLVRRSPKPSPRVDTQAPQRATSNVHGQDSRDLRLKLLALEAAGGVSNQEIARLKDGNSQMLSQLNTMGKDLTGRRMENQTLRESLSRLSDQFAQQTAQNENYAQLLARIQAELEDSQTRGKALEAENGAEKAEVATLSQQLSSKTTTIANEREMLAEGRDITDLMGARNLHIIDVRDADGKGRNQKSFGRIFYTEGKSLIFYAYDLDEGKVTKANYSFEVWGERLGEPTSVRNLGILYTDDKDQRRWALTVDDPQQLAEIDSVFVTLESRQGANKPLGGKILFAFLGGRANHP